MAEKENPDVLSVGAVVRHKHGDERRKVARWFGKRPETCQLCGASLADGWIDGATSMGPWANLCVPCHRVYGRGLGLGRGQQYDKDGVKVGG